MITLLLFCKKYEFCIILLHTLLLFMYLVSIPFVSAQSPSARFCDSLILPRTACLHSSLTATIIFSSAIALQALAACALSFLSQHFLHNSFTSSCIISLGAFFCWLYVSALSIIVQYVKILEEFLTCLFYKKQFICAKFFHFGRSYS